MEEFKKVIEFLTQIALVFTTVQVYLQVNKIWKRKQDKDVAESQSIAGLLLMAVNCILSICYYTFVQDDILSTVDTSLYLFQSLVFALISTGIFVKSTEKRNIWASMRKALKLERKEANYLIKKFFKPNNAEIIINILHQIAMIDDNLDPKEEELIMAFAKEWKIDYSIEKLNAERSDSSESNFMRLRDSVQSYLSDEPAKEQAAQLRDMMQTLINVDDNVSPEEELIAGELLGLIETYIHDGDKSLSYDVLIVPQKNEHHEFIQQLLPNAAKFEVAGGTAYSMGSFYSQKYAEMICNQYREVNLFTIVHAGINKDK
jgi:hypothetical protein